MKEYRAWHIREILDINMRTFRSWIYLGKLKARKSGHTVGQWCVDKKDFRTFMRISAQTTMVRKNGRCGGTPRYIRTSFEGV